MTLQSCSWLLIDGAGNERVSCQHSFVLDSGMNKKVHVTHFYLISKCTQSFHMHRVLFQQFLFKDKDGTDSSLFNVTLLMFKFLLYFRAQLSQHQEQAARVVVV